MDIVGGGCPILNELQVKIRTVTECSKAVDFNRLYFNDYLCNIQKFRLGL